jgi:hypothetical protein
VPPAAPAAVPAEIAELEAVKVQTQEVAAAKTEFAEARSNDASLRQAIQPRGGVAGFAGGVVGGAAGGIAPPPPPPPARAQRVSMLNLVSTPRDAILGLSKAPGTPEKDSTRRAKEFASDARSPGQSKKIGDHNFIFSSGYWIDERCAGKVDAPIVEVKAGAAEYEEILNLYADLRALLPAIVYWHEKNWVLR